MRRAQQGGQGPAGAVRVDEASSASTFRELDDAFLQKQTKIWLGEVLHLRFDEDVLVADLLADGELLFQVSKVLWKRLMKKNREQLKQSKVYIYERLSFGRSNGKYMPYSKVDSFLKEGSRFVESDDIAKRSIPPQRPQDDAPKSGRGVLKRNKERSFSRVIPSLSEKPIQSNSTAKNMDKENVPDVYPGAQLKV
ncbi:hypothetical protein HU200_014624 [Digitaria exilis]|uniref:Uncharacterized protein n=1 Tax=Digitaria exilis TaxID=1010633 RepID=A0A835FC84_9POAL|nr:hypothetical protein HU200_014624 [Digitaria exilis]